LSGNERHFRRGLEEASIEFMAFDVFEIKTYGVLARLLLVDIADAM